MPTANAIKARAKTAIENRSVILRAFRCVPENGISHILLTEELEHNNQELDAIRPYLTRYWLSEIKVELRTQMFVLLRYAEAAPDDISAANFILQMIACSNGVAICDEELARLPSEDRR